ncbi:MULTISPECIES: flavodoxin family protein [unclassified Brenneria]|uniref:flavodoxin family protein n=1 Tax=unclassified Brenneria TaxID=2634434 RepID=UPI001557A056|nr:MULTISPECIES: flavodoxin family protein [unclassified Brenneria]MEE3645147.1 flavodoxin family protein [Brenneria sp. L3_3C_1]MEE3652783.1 flavodoxin family protein [Brenneria sp. HEZEL_4_2_4]MBJ7223902.1 flavodoxin family protein [Brenneria sp. L3-3C-1]MEE3652802.1 flavodoxin family protein [Brenneria sp. HEZEL_4_2_4]NPD02738.1 flavodoxin family protein [Brenneria sp. hezel4-2-4]
MKDKIRYAAINGSERIDGNNARALEWAGHYLEEQGISLEVFSLADAQIEPCGACGDCNFRNEPCEQNDDSARAVRLMEASDGVIFASSVHGFGPTPLMSAFLERVGTGFLRHNRTLTNKVAGIIVTGRRMGHVEVYNQMLQCALLNRMIMVGYGFPAMLVGDKKGEVLGDSEGMEMMRRMIDRMVSMTRLMREYEQLTGRVALQVAEPGERHRVNKDGKFYVPPKPNMYQSKNIE